MLQTHETSNELTYENHEVHVANSCHQVPEVSTWHQDKWEIQTEWGKKPSNRFFRNRFFRYRFFSYKFFRYRFFKYWFFRYRFFRYRFFRYRFFRYEFFEVQVFQIQVFQIQVFLVSIYVFFWAVHWIFPSRSKTPKKKSRAFPLGGPSPCGNVLFFTVWLFHGFSPFFPHLFSLTKSRPNPKIQDTKSDIQNHQEHWQLQWF